MLKILNFQGVQLLDVNVVLIKGIFEQVKRVLTPDYGLIL